MSRIVARQSGTKTLTKECFETYTVRYIHNASRCIHNAYPSAKPIILTWNRWIGAMEFWADLAH
ncbi:MAG: hypothetical protein V7K35_16905 [Nostoc sp.]